MTGNAHKIRVFQGKNGEWFYEAKARNGRVLNVSEGYTRRANAKRFAERAYPGVPVVVVDA